MGKHGEQVGKGGGSGRLDKSGQAGVPIVIEAVRRLSTAPTAPTTSVARPETARGSEPPMEDFTYVPYEKSLHTSISEIRFGKAISAIDFPRYVCSLGSNTSYVEKIFEFYSKKIGVSGGDRLRVSA